MFVTKDRKLSTGSLIILIASTLLGVGILTGPRSITAAVDGFGGWIAVLLTGLLFILIAYAAAYLINMFPGENIILFGPAIVTKPINNTICFLYLLYFIISTALYSRNVADVMKLYVLDTTPTTVIIGSFLLVSTYTAVQGINVLIRLNMLLFPIIFGMLGIILVLNAGGEFNFTEARPFFVGDFLTYLNGMKSSLDIFIGIGIIYFLSVFLRTPEKTGYALSTGIIIVTLINMIIIVISLGVFNFASVQNIVYPTVELAKDIQLPGAFLERTESLFMTIWVLAIFNVVSVTQYTVSLGISQLFNRKRKLWVVWPLPIYFLIALAPRNIDEFFYWRSILSYVGFSFLLAIPLVYILIAKIRKVA
ncbi:GerAB/ArcD/ProY family transporter [Alteribacillus sp. YIM 98480]|uniref:GerAB/ArcD/ProY family transporter n=1 Tax=Alteribacillus sp. YIM 98480 TaxID=2606599 RepID=UPI00131C64A7|nr:GerAB/ArcD/ProY family transporter [Alteribacillus sp. YIM 98480]